MIDHVLTPFFGIAMVIAIILAVIVREASKFFHKDIDERKMKSEFLRLPVSNTLTVVGLLLPTLAALSGFLYTKHPNGDYSTIVTVIAVLLIVLVIAIWETFALLKKATTSEDITLKLPDDRRFITGLGIIYVYLIGSLALLVFFFLFDLPMPATKAKTSPATQYYIGKPVLQIGSLESVVEQTWGAPIKREPARRLMRYETRDSKIDLIFDTQGKLEQVVQTRR